MEHMPHDQQFYRNHVTKHKMTTVKQYSLLKRKMAYLLKTRENSFKKYDNNGILKYKQDHRYWAELTEELNSLGPPYRTVQQWKKVWCDFKRGQRKRSVNKATPASVQYTSKQSNSETDCSEGEIQIKSEPKDYEPYSPSMYTNFTNKFDNDYSYPDDDSFQESYVDEKESVLPDESSCSSYSYLNKHALGIANNQEPSNNYFATPPPLQPSNLPIPDRTTASPLQNQVEHQTKLLENIFQISKTLVSLIERQADVLEKQTDAMQRQALATEQHTAVMNGFIDMVREKMFKDNSQKTSIPTESCKNDIL